MPHINAFKHVWILCCTLTLELPLMSFLYHSLLILLKSSCFLRFSFFLLTFNEFMMVKYTQNFNCLALLAWVMYANLPWMPERYNLSNFLASALAYALFALTLKSIPHNFLETRSLLTFIALFSLQSIKWISPRCHLFCLTPLDSQVIPQFNIWLRCFCFYNYIVLNQLYNTVFS